jgi:succinoglycan biosynthesis protein ExoU
MILDGHPQVDVIIAAWSAETTIARAIRSVLAQPSVARVIVVDDASPDETVAAAQACDTGDGRLLIVRQEQNGGPSAARNRAIDAGSAEWVAILDSDDFMLADRIAQMLRAAADCDLLADDILVVDEGAEDAPPRAMLGVTPDQSEPISLAEFVRGNIAHRGTERAELGFIKPLIRRAFLDQHCLRYDEALRFGEDYDFYVRALANKGRLRLIPPCGYVYVQRPASLSGVHSEDDLFRLREVDRRALDIPGIDAQDKAALRAHFQSVDCRLQWRRVIRAVKAGEIGEFFGAFVRSPRVSIYLAQKLAEQMFTRTLRRVGLGEPSAA